MGLTDPGAAGAAGAAGSPEAPGEPLEACVFDLDGVIVDSEPTQRSVAVEVLAEAGIASDESSIAAFTGRGHRALFQEMLETGGPSGNVQRCLERFGELLMARAHDIPLAPGFEDLLGSLECLGVGVGVATSTPTAWARGLLEAVGIEPSRFEFVVGGDRVAHPKPAPDLYLLAVALLPAPAARCLAVEDSAAGMEAAAAAGLVIVQFAPGGTGDAAGSEEPTSARQHVIARIEKMSDFPLELFAGA